MEALFFCSHRNLYSFWMVETVTEERVVEVKEEVDMGEVVGTQSIAAKPLIDATGPAGLGGTT